jgi:catechol 2,3-dioxygenase-like lactoylglutathione lyase family enzyme
MDTLGIHHLGLAVSNLKATAKFFTDCLGWSIAREVPDYPAIFVTNGSAFVTLWQTASDHNATPFDRRKNVGLHHFAIKVASEQALDAVFEKAAAHPGVGVEFAPELLRGGPAKHCMLFEPSGIRVEFIWAP